MVQVKCEYVNVPNKKQTSDYFIYTDIEVMGHADALDMPHTTGIKVCAGISACCYGIRRLVNDDQFKIDIKSGYFHIWTNIRNDMKNCLDRETVYALNTLVCQLYELYCAYPNSFKSFDLIDVKEKIEDERKRRNEECWSGRQGHPRNQRRRLQRMGLYSIVKGSHIE